jgi:hypothetical protein
MYLSAVIEVVEGKVEQLLLRGLESHARYEDDRRILPVKASRFNTVNLRDRTVLCETIR